MQNEQNEPVQEMRMEMQMKPVAVNDQVIGRSSRPQHSTIGEGEVKPLTQSEFENVADGTHVELDHDPENPPSYDWADKGLPEADADAAPMGDAVPTHWSLLHGALIGTALEQLNSIDDMEARTWLGNLYLCYQQQCGTSGLDWAMAFTETSLNHGPQGTEMTLSYIKADYDVRMLETHDAYYVIKAEPEGELQPEQFHEMLKLQLKVDIQQGLMIGAEHARNMGNGLVSNFTEAMVIYFDLTEDSVQLNPIVEAIRSVIMYLVDQGYAPDREYSSEELAADMSLVRLVHREYAAGVDLTIRFDNIRDQYENMLVQVKREADQNNQGLVQHEEQDD